MTTEESRVLRNLRLIYVARLTSFVCGFVLVPLLIAWLGVDQYGLWVLVTAIFGYAGILDLGVSGAVTRYVAEHRGAGSEQDLQKSVQSAFGFAMGAGAIAAVFLLFISLFGYRAFALPPALIGPARAVLALMSVRALFAFAFSIPDAAVKGFERYDLTSLINTVMTIVNLASVVLLVQLKFGLVEIAMLSIFVPATASLISAIALQRIHPGIDFRIVRHPWQASRGLFAFAAASATLTVANILMYQADVLIVGTLLSVGAVTVYSVVAKFSQAIREFEFLSLQALVPLVSRLHGAGREQSVARVLRDGVRYLTAIEFTIVATLIAFSRTIIEAWVGPAFAPWAPLAQAFLVYYFLVAPLSMMWAIFAGRGKLGTMVKVVVATSVLNVSLSIALTILLQSVSGVILGTILSVTLMYPLAIWLYSRELGFAYWQPVFWSVPALACAIVSLSVGFLFQALVPFAGLLVVLAGVAVALLAGWATYAFVFLGAEERKRLFSAFISRSAA